MSDPQAHNRRQEYLGSWEQREPHLFRIVPFVLLFLSMVADVLGDGFHGKVPLNFALCGALLALMLLGERVDKRKNWDTEQCRVPLPLGLTMLLAFAGLATALVLRAPMYGFYAWTEYIWAFRLMPGMFRFAGVAIVAVPVAMSQTGGGPYRSFGDWAALAGVYLVNAVLASLFSWFGYVGSQLQRERKAEVSELTEANRRLSELQQQLVDQARERAVVDERRRLAREIHDTLAQGLMGIITQLQASGSDADPHVRAAIDLARDSLSEARRSVNALAPQSLAGTKLHDAIQGEAERWSARQDVPVAVTTTGEPRTLAANVEVALLRATQEALANVAKHADAGRVGITLSYMEDQVSLDVRDDGVGFDPSELCERNGDGGFGLAAMRERIEGVSGRLTVESEPAAGTALSASVPVLRPITSVTNGGPDER